MEQSEDRKLGVRRADNIWEPHWSDGEAIWSAHRTAGSSSTLEEFLDALSVPRPGLLALTMLEVFRYPTFLAPVVY